MLQVIPGARVGHIGLYRDPATLKAVAGRQVEVSIGEGRYHQVRRMFAACGLHVEKLHRIRVGSVELDTSLAPGEYRPLTQAEIDGVSS